MTALAILEATSRRTPRPPAVAALAEHGAACRQCRENAAMGLPIRSLCAAGILLARMALRARAKRSL